jgi:hypothetical protein
MNQMVADVSLATVSAVSAGLSFTDRSSTGMEGGRVGNWGSSNTTSPGGREGWKIKHGGSPMTQII